MRLERELMRGAGPVAVLKLLSGGPMYGYELIDALAQRTKGVLDLGQATLYPLLYNLEAKGLVEAFWQESDAGRERKYYRLTDKGRQRLAEDTEQMRNLSTAMRALGILQAHGHEGVPA